MTTPALLPFDDARTWLLDRARRLTETEVLPLVRARGRILARDVVSRLAVPPQDNSAMDGFALRVADWAEGKTLPVSQRVPAGTQPQPLQPGTAARIFTGAPVPAGADCVVMQEQCRQKGDCVLVASAPRAGQNIRRAGEDIARGAVVLTAGQRLGPQMLGLAASMGCAMLPVFRRLRVALFSTGDELQLPSQPLGDGQIYDTNRLAVHLMLEQLGCEVINLGIIRDDPEQLRQTFIEADQQADVVISSGGVSVGEADYTKTILDELGEISFWKLAIKPGKPFAFGKLSNSWFCGLPGNPVSAALTFYQLVQPLLAKLSAGSAATQAPRLRVRTTDVLKKSPGRLDFQRGLLTRNENGELTVATTGHQGSHIFSSFSQGNCFIVLERERGRVEAGEWVEVEPFNHLLGGL